MLSNVLPLDLLREKFPDIQLEQVSGTQNLPKLIRDAGPKIYGMALHQWDRLVAFGPEKVDPMAVAKWVRQNDPNICTAITNIIKHPLVLDISYIHATVPRDGRLMTVAEMMIAHLHPGELHLADIEYSNPDEPLPLNKQKRFKAFNGLGLLPVTIDRLMEEAGRLGCHAVTLTAASSDLMQLFKKYGFNISNTPAARMSEQAGSYPMERRLTV